MIKSLKFKSALLMLISLALILSASAISAGPDTQPPLINLQAPKDFSYQRGVFNIDLSVRDNSEVNSVTFFYSTSNSGPWNKIGMANLNSGTSSSGIWREAWDTTPLEISTVYIKAQAVDLAGNSSESPVYTFYLNNKIDTTVPEVTITDPVNGANNGVINDVIKIIFNKELDPSTINASTVFLLQGSSNIPGTVSYADKTIQFTPSSQLNYSSSYTLQITTSVKDTAGHPMAQDFTTSFATGPAPTQAPNPVNNVFAKALGSTSVGIRWTKVDDAESYNIYRDTSKTGSFLTLIKTVKATSSSAEVDYYVDENLPSSTTYWYRVAAVNSIGESAKSQDFVNMYTDKENNSKTVYLNCADTLPPTYPTGVNLGSEDTTVQISWVSNPETNLRGYNIYRGTLSGGTLTKVNASEVPRGNTSYKDTSLANDTEYFYRLTAVDSFGNEGPKSVEKRVVPKAPAFGSVPHTGYSSGTMPCDKCHSTHTGEGSHLNINAAEQTTCFLCHDGTASKSNIKNLYSSSAYTSKHPIGTTLTCSNCHDSHLDAQSSSNGTPLNPGILSVWRNGINFNKGNDICFSCHGPGSTLPGGDIETPWYSSGRVVASSVTSPNGIECSTCHQSHASQSSALSTQTVENQCLQCHDRSASSSELNKYDALINSPDSISHHDLLADDRAANGSSLTCSNCHNPHDNNKTFKLIDPDNPGPNRANIWKGISEPSVQNPLTGTINEYCLKCHSGSLPTAQQTSPYADAPSYGNKALTNIQDSYYTSAKDFHGANHSTTVVSDPVMGYVDANSGNSYVECTKCHDAMGSSNAFNLVTMVTSADGHLTKEGQFVYSWQYKSGTQTKVGADLRFFCQGCHGNNHMGFSKPYPTDCLSCHSHGNNM
jgi:predicted CXXCH cytochrome family protein